MYYTQPCAPSLRSSRSIRVCAHLSARPMAKPHAACLCSPCRVNVASHRRWRNHTHSTPLQLTFVVPPHSYASSHTLLIPFHTSRCRVRVIHVCHRDTAAYRDEQGSAARVQCSKSSGVGAVQGGFHSPATTLDFISLAARQPIVTFLRAPTLLS
jgi:hypothetical protein